MEFNFNFDGFEKSGKSKREAIDYLKGLNSSVDFEKLESDFKNDDDAIYDALKSANFTFSKESEAEKSKRLKETYTKNQEKKTTFWDFNQKANESESEKLERKKALYENYASDYGLLDQIADTTLETTGLNYALDLGQAALNKIGLGNEDYISTSEREKIEKDLTQKAREKIANGAELKDLSAGEKFALKRTQEYYSDKHALKSEKEKARLIKKGEDYTKDEIDFMEDDLGFFHTLFNDERESIKEFKDKYKSENIIASDIQKAINRVKQFSEGELLWNAFSNDKEKKEKFQQEILQDAFKIAELNGFDDVGLDRENQLYFIKKDKEGNEQKYAVNTGFLDNFVDTLMNAKFEIAGGIGASIAAAKKAKGSPLSRAGQIIGAGAAGSYAGAFSDAMLNDIYLNRESNFQRNLDYALQAGLLSAAGDGVVMAAPFVYKKAIKPAYEKGKEFIGNTALGLVRTVPSANIQAAEKIVNEAYTQELKDEIKQAKEAFGGGAKNDDLHNGFLSKIRKNYETKYGKLDKRTQRIQTLEDIFTNNSIKDKQQEILELVRSDKDGQTLAYLLEVAKDDAKIQNNLKQMLNFSTQGVEQSLKNLNINPRDIKNILDEFEAGNKQAFKEVENQISKIYDDNIKVVLDRGEFENFKDELLQNGVTKEESLGFLQDLENNVFNKNGVTFTQLNNFRKNLNYYIFNKDKTPNFVNTVKKIAENKLKGEIDKGIENIFNELPNTAVEVKKLYSQSLKDYAAMKELNESLKRLKLQDKELEADKVVDNLIKYAKGQGEAGENNLQSLKNYLGEENNAFLEMQILNRLFKGAIVENEQAKMRVFDSGEFIKKVKELAGEVSFKQERLSKESVREILSDLKPSSIPNEISVDEFLSLNDSFVNKQNYLKHIEKDPKRKKYLNLIEPTLNEPDIAFKNLENGVEKEKFIKKFSNGKDFFYILATKDNKKTILTAFKTDKINTILKEFDNADIIPTFIRQGSKNANIAGTTTETIPQPFFKSKEARDFLDLVQGFDRLYKNDAGIARTLNFATAEKLGTALATSAEGAIKQKIVKGAFDPIFRLLPDGIFFGLFSKQIQGAALRYHLKKALSRSLNYDDFKIKLENQLKKGSFNSKTKLLIDDFMQNLDSFNKEKEKKLKELEEKRLQEEEESRRRLNKWKLEQEQEFAEANAHIGQDAISGVTLKQGRGIEYKGLNKDERVYLKDNAEPLELEYAVVKKDDIKPQFNFSGLQGRVEKQERLIEKIKQDFNPDLIIAKRGDLRNGNPILFLDGQVLAGNHRSEALKGLEGEALENYKRSVKEHFGVDLNDDEMLVRMVKDGQDEEKIKKYAFGSNEGLENSLSEQSLSLFSKYKDKIDALKKDKILFEAEDVYNLKALVNKALGESSITKENDTNKALFASLVKGANNNIVKALGELEKENLEEVSKIASMFFDNAGNFYNLTHDIAMPKMQNIQDFLSDGLVSTARSAHSRAEDFERLNHDIGFFLATKDKEAALKLDPKIVKNLKSKTMGLALARFARLEDPSGNLFDFLKNLKETLHEKGQPSLFDEKGIALNTRNEYDFLEELILSGQMSEEQFKLVENLRGLREWEESRGSGTQNKISKKLKLEELDSLELATKEQLREFLEKIKNKDYKNSEKILKIANLNDDLKELLKAEKSGVFLTRARAAHISERRKATYNQALSMEEQLKIPSIINEAREFYKDDKKGFILPFKDEANEAKINLIILDKDNKGNFLITAKKINKSEFENGSYERVSRAGVEPATTTLNEQKPTEAISLDSETIPQKSLSKQELEAKKIQEVKEIIKEIKTKSRMYSINRLPKYRARDSYRAQSADERKINYRDYLMSFLKDKGIDSDFMELEVLSENKTMTQKAKNEARNKIYLRMYETMQKLEQELAEKARLHKQTMIKEAEQWLAENQGASSEVDYVFKKKMADIDKDLRLALKDNNVGLIDTLNRKMGKLTYAKNGDLGKVRIPQVEKFYPKGQYPINLKNLQDIQKEYKYKDKNLIINNNDFSKPFNIIRAEIEARIGVTPLKEFGTNYAEFYHDGKGAVEKLIKEAQSFKESKAKGEFKGQVSGAFYREELGDIDLVWGDDNFGLKHILEQRTKQWGEEKALKFISHLSENMQNGQIVEVDKGRIGIKTDLTTIILDKKENNNFILTAFRDRNNKKELESLNLSQPKTFTNESGGTNAKESPFISLNQNQTIPQKSLLKQENDSNRTKPYAVKERIYGYKANLEKFLQDNHKIANITKNKKVQRGYNWVYESVSEPRKFYHYTRNSKLNEFDSDKDNTGLGFWFVSEPETNNKFISKMTEQENKAHFGNSKKEVYLSIKKPFLDGEPISSTMIQEKEVELKEFFKDNKEALEFINKNKDKEVEKLLEHLKFSRGQEKAKDFKKLLENKGYDSINFEMNRAYGGGIVVFNPTQIKAVGNKGSFDTSNANIFHSNQHLGAGLAGGTLNGFSEDENGNISFNPQDFLKGFIYGAGGSLALKKGLEAVKKNPAFKEALKEEIKNELRKGGESLARKYPIFANLALPKYAISNEKALDARARVAMKELEKEQKGLYNVVLDKKEMRKEAREKLDILRGKEIINKKGVRARLSSVGIAKMTSDKAIKKSVDNGFSIKDHFEAVEDIERIFINSEFLRSEKPKNQSRDIRAVHRFISNNALKNKEANALITLKESYQNGNRIYSLELDELTTP